MDVRFSAGGFGGVVSGSGGKRAAVESTRVTS